MIKVKRVEIRDRGTFIPAVALQVTGGSDEPLLERAGFSEDPLIVLIHLEGLGCHWDAFEWPANSRTMHEAHRWLEQHWNEQKDGGVLDIEFILGETKISKVSEVA